MLVMKHWLSKMMKKWRTERNETLLLANKAFTMAGLVKCVLFTIVKGR